MTAKQTALSASLVALLAAPALAEEPPEQPPGEVRPMPLIPKREPTGTFQIGAGYSSDHGFVARARVEQASLFGTGKLLAIDTTISAREQDMRVIYEDPGLFGTQLRLRGDLYFNETRYIGFTREAVGGELTVRRTVAPGLEVFAGYRGEHVRVESNDTVLARGVGGEWWSGGFLSSLRAGAVYSSLDQPVYPTRGFTAGVTVDVADHRLGSELDFVRTDAWLAYHRPLGPFVLHASARSRTVTSVPLSERLHFDGSSDVRGYAPGAVGPKDALGQPVGGNLLWSARTELEAPVGGGLSVAGFVDAGGLHDDKTGENVMSAGFGVIWRSPIGPLRFDVAYPLSGDREGPRYIFGIGGIF